MIQNDIWDKYENRGIIGSGGFSYVYKALNKKLGYYVAIKEINKEKYKEKTKLIFKESEIMKKMNLENSISLKETFENNQFYYIIMDLCICNLEEYLKIREECLSINEIFEVLNQLNNTFKLLKEIEIMKKIKTENNVLINEVINNKEYLYIIMDLCEYNLEENIKRREKPISIHEINNF